MNNKENDKFYRNCVGMMIINHEKKIFSAERHDFLGAWQMPQGGIEKNEKPLFAAFRDFFGGRSKAVQDTLRDARRTVLAELRKEALMVGADAVIAIDLDYQEISGGQKHGMLMLVASGTAVKVK